jgi:hypothetical protein
MGNDFIAELVDALKRVLPPDVSAMRDLLIVSGIPENTENLRYLAFNRQTVEEENRLLEFSAVAIVNNRRVPQWRLEGYRKKVSQMVFRWTRNHLDLFLNNLRCDPAMMDVLASSTAGYTLMGILKVEERPASGFLKRKVRFFRPVIAVPGIDEDRLQKVIEFERANEIPHSFIKRLPLVRKAGQGTTSS